MKFHLRVVVFGATVLICTFVAAGLSSDLLPAAPDMESAIKPPVVSQVADVRLLPQQLRSAVSPTKNVADTMAAAKAPVTQRDLVVIDQAKQRTPLTDEERVRRRAAAVASKLKLSIEEENALLVILLEEQTSRADTLSELRRAPKEGQAVARAELNSIRAWKSEQLRQQFGVARANVMLKRR
jgi:hypothetical protein